MHRVGVLPVLLLLGFLASFSACGPGNDPSLVQFPPVTVGPDGGVVNPKVPHSPLHGMSIDVPKGALSADQEFSISHRIFPGELPEGLTLLTPLIKVENGGGFAEEVMTVTIPVKVPDGEFAMGFFVDSEGELEPMPLVDLTPTSITLATRHFSEFLVAALSGTLIGKTVDTGFRPGRDDWQFENRGSFISPRGHCAGQSLTAAWYWYEKAKRGEPALNGRYDNNGGPATPDVWEDDSFGYRLASTVQKDIDFKGELRKAFNALSAVSDELTWKAFLYSMQITKEPQYVSIRDTDKGGGHALIAWAANVEKGILYVADPNYPGVTTRGILFENDKFYPYESGENIVEVLLGHSKSYDQVRYNAKTALVPFRKIGARWKEFEAGTIGNDRFPKYELTHTSADNSETVLSSRIRTSDEKLDLRLECESEKSLRFRIRAADGWTAFTSKAQITLGLGANRYGFHIRGEAGGGHEWVDFLWVDIERVEEMEEPEEVDTPEVDPEPPGDGVIAGVYYGQLKTNTRSTGMMIFITDAEEKIALRTHARILSEKKDDWGNVVETEFRFERGLGSPGIPPGRWKVCAGPRVGKYYARSDVVTVGRTGTVRVEVGTKPQ